MLLTRLTTWGNWNPCIDRQVDRKAAMATGINILFPSIDQLSGLGWEMLRMQGYLDTALKQDVRHMLENVIALCFVI